MRPWSAIREAILLHIDNDTGFVQFEIPPVPARVVRVRADVVELVRDAKIGDKVCVLMMEDGTLRVARLEKVATQE